jgi:hypothetical protein
VVIARAARGLNDQGAAARLRIFLEAARDAGASNWGHGRGGARLNAAWDDIVGRLADLATVTVVFDDAVRLESFLVHVHDLSLDLSITVSGDMAAIADLCARHGWQPHSGRQALGVFGGLNCLPPQELLCITAQCGHGLIATRLVEALVARIRDGHCTAAEAAETLARPCVCGLVNPGRTATLLGRLAEDS